jgi:hypothetical protein
MGSGVQSDKDDEIDDILADTNEMQGKLPDNNIMGSSVKTNKDDEIDEILIDTNEMQGKLPLNNIADQTLIDTDLTSIENKIDLLDTNVDTIVNKLPTNEIMGSSVKSDKDDEIDAIKAQTDQMSFSGTDILATLDGEQVNLLTATQTQIDTIETGVGSIESKVDIIDSIVDTLLLDMKRVLGLTHENVYEDSTVHDANGRLTQSRIRIYSAPASVGTVNDVIATYQMNATFNVQGEMQSYKVVKQ